MNLKSLGWADHWNELLSEKDNVARVTAAHRSLYQAISDSGELNCYLSGKFHHQAETDADYPAVGDWVVISPEFVDESQSQAAMIKSVLPRRSKISRVAAGNTSSEQVIAANLDYVFIVTSANAELNSKRLRRYVILAKEGKVAPIIVISKVDLHSQYTELISGLEAEFKDIRILPTSSENGHGIDVLHSYLKPGTTSAFIGSSGVGKSTLVNQLLAGEIQSTKTIREGDDKGRHTTTTREMFFLQDGGMIIDTPGLREVQVFGDDEAIQAAFTSIDELIGQCKFSDCSHSNEPGCAILHGLETGEISQEDIVNYRKLADEMQVSNEKMEKRQSSSAKINAKKRWKEINVNYKKRKKLEGR